MTQQGAMVGVVWWIDVTPVGIEYGTDQFDF